MNRLLPHSAFQLLHSAFIPILLLALTPSLRAADKSEPLSAPVAEAATLRCLGVYWIIQGDDNQNAKVEFAYRKTGTQDWKPVPNLFRVAKGACKDKSLKLPEDAWLFAGSAIDVPEATDYELRLKLIDPDGGNTEKIIPAHTIAEPSAPPDMKTYHVIPGNGGGTGTQADPFKGVNAAEKNAKPGDLFLVHAGTYEGTWAVRKSGEEGKPIVWQGATDGEAIFKTDIPIGPEGYPPGHVIEASNRHDVWFENLTVRGQAYSDFCLHECARVVVRRCKLEPFLYGIYGERNSTGNLGRLFISDNTIHGRQPWPATSKQWEELPENRGINLGGVGNVICYNRVDHCKDGIDTVDGKTPTIAAEIFGNDVSECYDDGAEMDGSHRNCRNFLNRYTNTLTGISFQPVYGGPVYAVRNVVYNARSEFLKLHNSPSGAVIVHNTFVHNGPLLHISTSEQATNCYMRNNLFVGTAGPAVDFDLPMKAMDFDYDGFAGAVGGGPFFLRYSKIRYATPEEVRAKSPIEKHVVIVNTANLFASGIKAPEVAADYDANAPGYSWTTGLKIFKPETIDLRLDPKSNAVGAGEPLPGFNDGTDTKRPDLGAYPVGSALPQYGPRPEKKI